MKKLLLYGHGGACNHGAEAILRSSVPVFRKAGVPIYLSTHFPAQDRTFGLDRLVDRLIPADLSLVPQEKAAMDFAQKERVAAQIYRDALAEIDGETVCIGVGGDNYCYPNWHRQSVFHRTAKERGGKSVLWGCSVQPERIDARMAEVLRSHDRIYARESLTAEALQAHGVQRVILQRDPAFGLVPQPAALPDGFFGALPGRGRAECPEAAVPPDGLLDAVSGRGCVDRPHMPQGGLSGSAAAINLSPLMLRKSGRLLEYFVQTARFLLGKADTLVLLSHVTMPVDDDGQALKALWERLSPAERVRTCAVPEEWNAAQRKYLVSRCEMLVCCRTHAAIAGYSCAVPTLAVGYSVKALGIGKDLGMERWVLPAEQGEQLPALAAALWEQRAAVRASLRGRME